MVRKVYENFLKIQFSDLGPVNWTELKCNGRVGGVIGDIDKQEISLAEIASVDSTDKVRCLCMMFHEDGIKS